MGTVHYLRSADRHLRSTRRRRTNGGKSPRPRSPSLRQGQANLNRGTSVIPFPVHRTTARAEPQGQGQLRNARARQRPERWRSFLLLLSLGALTWGLSGLESSAWLSYLDVVLGVLGLIDAGSKAYPSRGRRWLLGWGALTIAGFALWEGLRGWPTWWTVAFGLAFLASARKRAIRSNQLD